MPSSPDVDRAMELETPKWGGRTDIWAVLLYRRRRLPKRGRIRYIYNTNKKAVAKIEFPDLTVIHDA